MFPTNQELKKQAKSTLRETFPFWIKLTVVLVGCSLMVFLITQLLMGQLIMMEALQLRDYPTAQTDLQMVESGVEFIFRIDQTNLVLAGYVSYLSVAIIIMAQIVLFILIAPLKMAALEKYWQAFRKEQMREEDVLKWYKKPSLFAKSVIVELFSKVTYWIASVIGLLPAFLLIYLMTLMKHQMASIAVVYLYYALLIAGLLFGFYIHVLMQPLAYCLVAKPEYTIKQVIIRGLGSTKQYHKEFFKLRFSFILWHVLSSISYDLLEIYVFPYVSVASFYALEAMAKSRHEKNEQPIA